MQIEMTELAALLNRPTTASSHPWKIGQAYLIRTSTMHLTGRLVAVHEHELVLEQAAWIADTGRFHNALVTGALVEVEPMPGTVLVGRGAVIDAAEWRHALPDQVK